MEPPASFSDCLSQLGQLIVNLPEALPYKAAEKSCYHSFNDLSVPEGLVEKTGDEASALNEHFKAVFGWKTRTSGDGTLDILERGPGIQKVVRFLEHFHAKYPKDTVLQKWGQDIWRAAVKVYGAHGKEVPAFGTQPSKSPSGSSHVPIEIDSDADDNKEQGSGKARVGHPTDELLNAVATRFLNTKKGTKYKWRCISPNCKVERAGNLSTARVFPHAASCPELRKTHPELQKQVLDRQADESLGAQQEQAQREQADGQEPASKKPRTSPAEADEASSLADGKIGDWAKEGGRQQQAKAEEKLQNKVDKAIMLVLCVCGVPPNVVDTPQWKNLMNVLNPAYKPTSAEIFVNKWIPKEAAWVRKKQNEILKKSANITLSFDGGSTRQDSVALVHATPGDTRESFFIDGHVSNRERHTAEWYADRLKQSAEPFKDRIVAVVSDRASNASGARDIMIKDIAPAALNLGDCCHHIHNTLKDIGKMPEFIWMMQRVRPTITHFSKSPFARTALKDLGDETGEAVLALQKPVKSRFGSNTSAVKSLNAILSKVRTLVQNKTVKFKNKSLQAMFSRNGRETYTTFESRLQQFIDISEPFARSIWSLESSLANLSDVYVFWHAACMAVKDVFENAEGGIEKDIANGAIDIINDRYDQVFDPENDQYFVTFALDRRYPTSDILMIGPSLPPTIVLPGPEADLDITNPKAFYRVKYFLKNLLRSIVEHYKSLDSDTAAEVYPLIDQLGPADAVEEFAQQLPAFWRGERPFHTPVVNGDIAGWWKKLLTDSNARVLAFLAVRLFDISPNSMPDERTASRFTWLNSALRGRQRGHVLVDMILVSQWYLRQENTEKARRRPIVKFRDVGADMLGRIQSASAAARQANPDDSDTDSDDEDVGDEPVTKSREEHPLLPNTTVAMQSSRAGELLRDMLSEKSLVAPPPTATPSVTVSQAAEKKRKHREVDWDAF